MIRMNEELKTITKIIQETTKHDVLDKYIVRPKIDEDKILVLLSMFRENNTYKNIDKYIASILIIQMALEIHDTIAIQQLDEPRHVKAQQLTVLAGDFYSAQYYSLLAELEDFKMVSYLSEAIQQQNERKTEAFNENLGYDRLFGLLQDIETIILTKIAQVLGLSHWIVPLKRFFSFKRILTEKQKVLEGKTSGLLKPFFSNDSNRKAGFVKAADSVLKKLSLNMVEDQDKSPSVFMNLCENSSSVKKALCEFGNKRKAEEGLT